MLVEVSDPPQCCVTPIAQRMQTDLAVAISVASWIKVSRGMPLTRSPYSSVNGSSDFTYSSKWFTHFFTKSMSAMPLSRMYLATVHSHTSSVEGLGRTNRSARSANCLACAKISPSNNRGQ